MPIRNTLIQELARKHVINLTSDHILNDVAASFDKLGSSENETYIVVNDADRYWVATMPELAAIVEKLGPEAFIQPLRNLPLSSAYRVIAVDEMNSGEAKSLVSNQPGRPFVIVDSQGFVALFLNVNLSGLEISAGSFMGLHGELVEKDGRVKVQLSVPKPICPHCGHQDFYKFQAGTYTCRSCGKAVDP